MDALLSVPVLGYFLMPSLTTYSASLNLLFFYMTWSTLVLSHPPLKVEIVGTLAIRVLFFLVPSTLFLLFDTAFPSLSVSIKTQGTSALPTRTGGVQGARGLAGRPSWYQVVGLSLFNVCLTVAIQAGVEVLFTDVFQIRSALKITTTLPMPWSIAKDVLRGLALREILQYYTHRMIHEPPRPNVITNLHKTYHHALTAPYSFAAHFDHPLPYVLWRFLPIYLPSIVFRTHFLTYLVLLAIVSLEETLVLSGYSIVPGIMLGGFTRRQELHNRTKGKGNFAPWGFLDWVHGTSIGADVIDDVKAEAEKHEVAERTDRALKNAKASGKKGIKALSARRKAPKSP